MATYTVNVYGIFTPGSASGSNATQRRARLMADVAAANRTWTIGGVSCINFVAAGTFTTGQVIDASNFTFNEAFNGPITAVIDRIRTNFTDNRTGIYVVYTSGGYFRGGTGRTIGVGGVAIRDARSDTDYKIFGRVGLTNNALNTYAFAHEAGHNLFATYVNSRLTSTDPSGPYINPQTGIRDPNHNNDRNNIMYPTVPNTNPIITNAQCQKARSSKLVITQG
ncbi:hypothetical protein ABFY54_01970 [Priestia megaterium]|uniref:hypothetical protein n=1 Tax=Priestia megaterium TaxID=1404 RepID=UPI003D274451